MNIIIKTKRKQIVVIKDSIISIVRNNEETIIRTDKKEMAVKKPLSSFLKTQFESFVMINRNTIINISKVIEYNSNGNIIVGIDEHSTKCFLVSRKYKKEFSQRLLQQYEISI